MAEAKRANLQWLVAAALLVLLVAIGAFLFPSCESDGPPPAPLLAACADGQRAAPPATAPAATTKAPTALVGTWSGKWDGIYPVQFTISRDPQDQQFHVIYQWEERLGQPMKRREWPVTE